MIIYCVDAVSLDMASASTYFTFIDLFTCDDNTCGSCELVSVIGDVWHDTFVTVSAVLLFVSTTDSRRLTNMITSGAFVDVNTDVTFESEIGHTCTIGSFGIVNTFTVEIFWNFGSTAESSIVSTLVIVKSFSSSFGSICVSVLITSTVM